MKIRREILEYVLTPRYAAYSAESRLSAMRHSAESTPRCAFHIHDLVIPALLRSCGGLIVHELEIPGRITIPPLDSCILSW
jgi:hypothetical protein